jgi:hypothetical protein
LFHQIIGALYDPTKLTTIAIVNPKSTQKKYMDELEKLTEWNSLVGRFVAIPAVILDAAYEGYKLVCFAINTVAKAAIALVGVIPFFLMPFFGVKETLQSQETFIKLAGISLRSVVNIPISFAMLPLQLFSQISQILFDPENLKSISRFQP